MRRPRLWTQPFLRAARSPLPCSPSGFKRRRSSERPALLFFIDHRQRTAVVEVLHLALALELDPEAQLVLRVRVAQCVFVRAEAAFVEIVERLVESLHAE